MALLPKATVQLGYPDQLLFYIEDTTGDYNVDTNPGGYGAPNPEKSDVTVTKLYLAPPGSDEYTEIDDFGYLPTDEDPAEVTCDQFNPVEEEEEDTPCADCPPMDPSLTSCEEEEVTCFVDGCWTFKYEVYTGAPPFVLAGTVIFKQLFYGLTLEEITAIGKRIKEDLCNCSQGFDAEFQFNLIKNDFDSMLLTANLETCDCSCVTFPLASLEKRLTMLTNECGS